MIRPFINRINPFRKKWKRRSPHLWITGGLPVAFFFISVLLTAFEIRHPEPFVLDYPANFGSRFSIPADNPTTQEGVYLGRMLFYEPMLSADNSISCAGCHQQKLAFTDGKKFSDGIHGALTSRNAMSLANLLWVRQYFWDGRASSLEEQAAFPLTDPHEMGQSLEESVRKLQATDAYPPLFKQAFGSDRITGSMLVKALAQFQRTLISSNAPYDRYLAGRYVPNEQELRGMTLFERNPDPQQNIRGANCTHCHGGPKMYKELFHNNGLDIQTADAGRSDITAQSADHGRFRVPTLRNILLTAPYMHDGRFATIEEVLDHYSDHVQPSENLSSFIKGNSNQTGGTQLSLTISEKQDIIAFLGMLTDSVFINNPEFSNPHNAQ